MIENETEKFQFENKLNNILKQDNITKALNYTVDIFGYENVEIAFSNIGFYPKNEVEEQIKRDLIDTIETNYTYVAVKHYNDLILELKNVKNNFAFYDSFEIELKTEISKKDFSSMIWNLFDNTFNFEW